MVQTRIAVNHRMAGHAQEPGAAERAIHLAQQRLQRKRIPGLGIFQTFVL